MKRLYASLRGHFSTAHLYHQSQWSREVNEAEFDLCYSDYGHGHNYSIDVSYLVSRATARSSETTKPNYETLHRTVKHILDLALKDFDHRHLNFTHPAFMPKPSNIPDVISTTEMITEVLQSRIHTLWNELKHSPAGWTEVSFLGLQVWETEMLAASTEAALVSLARQTGHWSATKYRHAIRLASGESRSLELSIFNKNDVGHRAQAVAAFFTSNDGTFNSVEELCCSLQENLGQVVLLATKSDYCLLAGVE